MILNQGDTFKEDFIVSDEVYNRFIDLFNDKNPLHTDEQFALSEVYESVNTVEFKFIFQNCLKG